MKFKNRIVLRSIGLSLAFITGTVFCFPTPSTAHVVNSDILSIQLNQAETEQMVIDSNILSREGQRIVMDAAFTEKTIPITVNCQKVNLEEKQEVSGSFKVASSDETRLIAMLDKESVIFDGTEQTINLTLQLLEQKMPDEPEKEEPDTEKSETEEPETEKSETEVLDNPEVPDNSVPDPDVTTPEGTDDNTAEGLEDMVGIQVVEPVFTGTGLDEIPEETEDETKSEEETPEPKEPEDEIIADSEEAETEEACLLTEVVMTVGEQEFSVEIEIKETLQSVDDISGELEFCQSQYDPNESVKVINGKEEVCVLYGFPEMTRYRIEDKNYLLYSEGMIIIPAGKEVSFDLSKTGVEKDLTVTTTTGKIYTLKYEKLPKLAQTVSPMIVNEEGISLTLTKSWGKAEPVLKIENLTVTEGQAAWTTVETISAVYNEDGKLQITPDGAEAGTYRATVSWIENEVILYELEIPFFVQYQSGNWGGTGQ